MTSLLLALLLSADPQPPVVLMPGLQSVNLEPKRAEAYATRLAQRLTLFGVHVTTGAEVAAVLGYERQQQLLGCGDDTCRSVTVMNAPIDGLLVGTASKLGSKWTLDAIILAPGTAKKLATASATGTDEDSLLSSIPLVAEKLSSQLAASLGRELVARGTEERRPSLVKRLAWVPLAVGVAAGAGGAVSLGLAQGTAAQLRQVRTPETALTPAQTSDLVAAGKLQQNLGWVGVGVGVAGLAGAAAMFFLGGEEVVSAGLAFTPGGATLSVTGSF
ncbi:MAG: hypothetical protein ACOZQL_20585 [Myxococcota bacterium]